MACVLWPHLRILYTLACAKNSTSQKHTYMCLEYTRYFFSESAGILIRLKIRFLRFVLTLINLLFASNSLPKLLSYWNIISFFFCLFYSVPPLSKRLDSLRTSWRLDATSTICSPAARSCYVCCSIDGPDCITLILAYWCHRQQFVALGHAVATCMSLMFNRRPRLHHFDPRLLEDKQRRDRPVQLINTIKVTLPHIHKPLPSIIVIIPAP